MHKKLIAILFWYGILFCHILMALLLMKPTNSTHEAAHACIQDQYSGDWWVQFMNYTLGYWPKVLFSETGLGSGAAYLSWGGKVLNSGKFPGQTYTEMGSGHFPNEGFGKACYVRNLNVFQGFNFLAPVEVDDLQAKITNPACYNAIKGYDGAFGTTIYLGGNGASSPYCR